jgi:hypothetical protein
MSISTSHPSLRLRRSTHVVRTLFCLIMVTCLSVTAGAQSQGPFAKFVGTWRGSGKVLTTDRNSEKIRCTATYSEVSGGQSLSQRLVCASDSYRVEIRGFIAAEGQSVHGHWEEAVRQAAGQLVGQIIAGRFEGTISGPGFEARMSLVTTGLHQTIIVTPAPGDSVSRVEIALSRES